MVPAVATLIIRTEGRRPAGLERALASAFAQTVGPIEVIVVEDGGDTLSGLIPPPGHRLRHLSLAKCGRSAAGNAGLSAASSDLVGFLDDDDWLFPGHVAALAEALEGHPDAGAAFGLAEEIAVSGEPPRERRRRRVGTVPFSLSRLWLGNTLSIQSVLFRRRLFLGLGGFDESLDALEDWDLWLRYAASAQFIGVATATSAFTVPASRATRRARAKTHAPAWEKVKAKHAGEIASFTFAEIGALAPYVLENAEATWCLRRLWERLWGGP
jgi:hypothetical protein